MAVAAVVLYIVFLTVAFGVRAWQHHRRTGSTGIHRPSGRVGGMDWWGGVLFGLALILLGVGPALRALDVIDPIGALDARWLQVVGLTVALVGGAVIVVAQSGMGTSWRVGVDRTESTDLVTGGLFAVARNPIFSAMVAAAGGLVLMAPSAPGVAGLIALIAGVQVQVRGVEEPHLLAVHGDEYRRYASRVGRFVPVLGRLPARG